MSENATVPVSVEPDRQTLLCIKNAYCFQVRDHGAETQIQLTMGDNEQGHDLFCEPYFLYVNPFSPWNLGVGACPKSLTISYPSKGKTQFDWLHQLRSGSSLYHLYTV